MLGQPDPTAPDPGPEPQSEQLTNDQLIAKYGADLTDEVVTKMVMDELVTNRRLAIASDRKAKAESAAFEAWDAAYTKRWGSDEG